ncbi:hypothetical protein, partial [Prevotella sp.]|uniref:hypothetical protein n=1 Tax=Prevotella sp. TaxID=59823 RepID=UPI003AB94509
IKKSNCLSPFRGDGREVRKCSTFVLITDPLYLPLKRGGLVCPHLESSRDVLLKYCKTLYINLFRKQANCLSLFRGDGRGVRNDELSVYCVGYYRPPLTPPKVGRTGLSAS